MKYFRLFQNKIKLTIKDLLGKTAMTTLVHASEAYQFQKNSRTWLPLNAALDIMLINIKMT